MMVTILLCGLLFGAPAQRPSDIVRWSADPPAKTVRAGGVARITVKAEVEDGWKLYALTQPKGGPIPLAIAVPKDAPFSIVRKTIEPPLPKLQKDEVFELETQYYEREATFVVPVTVSKTLAAGSHSIPLDITFQACGESICLRPFTQRLDVKVTIAK